MTRGIANMKIRFYGVQGSGSTYPSRHESDALQDLMDYRLLKCVLEEVRQHLSGQESGLGELLAAEPRKEELLRYRDRFDIPRPRNYGGWTTCVHVEDADGHHMVFDCGSGFRTCAKDLQSSWGDAEERHLHIFGSHSHYDHTEGFDQAAVCFDPRNTIHIHGNYQFLYSLDSQLGIFSKYVRDEVLGVQTPINHSIMPAAFRAVEIRDFTKGSPPERGHRMERLVLDMVQPVEIGATRITAFEVCHSAPCLAYKIERGGKTFVFCTDHEVRHGLDPTDPRQKASEEAEQRLLEQAMEADVVYRDGQFLRSEYDGLTGIGSSGAVPRLDWGHSCIEDVQEMASSCRVKQTYIGHHDPNREWAERNWIDEALERSCADRAEKIELARAGTVMEL